MKELVCLSSSSLIYFHLYDSLFSMSFFNMMSQDLQQKLLALQELTSIHSCKRARLLVSEQSPECFGHLLLSIE